MNGRTRLDLQVNEALAVIAQTALGYIHQGLSVGEALSRAKHVLGVTVAPEHAQAVEDHVRGLITRDLMVKTVEGYLKEGKPARDAILFAIRDLGISIPEDRVEALIAYYDKEIARLKSELAQGNHVAGGQVVQVVSDEQFKDEAPK